MLNVIIPKCDSCWWMDSMCLWNDVNPYILVLTYQIIFQLWKEAFRKSIDECNRRDPVKCCELFAAFRIAFKFVEDECYEHWFQKLSKEWLPVVPDTWFALEVSLLKCIQYDLTGATRCSDRFFEKWKSHWYHPGKANLNK